jgi:hypothetical protein
MSRIPNLRRYYRIVFPVGARPWLRLGNTVLPVLDCSEGGLRVQVGSDTPFETGREVEGRVRFANGEERPVAGVVLRQEPPYAAVQLVRVPLPFGTVMRQQLELRRGAGPVGDG